MVDSMGVALPLPLAGKELPPKTKRLRGANPLSGGKMARVTKRSVRTSAAR
jgi:hypothetical protein